MRPTRVSAPLAATARLTARGEPAVRGPGGVAVTDCGAEEVFAPGLADRVRGRVVNSPGHLLGVRHRADEPAAHPRSTGR